MNRLLYLRARLTHAGWPPRTWVGRIAFFALGLDILLFALEKLTVLLRLSSAATLGGWVTFLTFVAFVLFSWLGFRWLRGELLWRLRNRLIVTYVFIGVIPVVLLVTLAGTAFYLFAGQFATFIVTSGLNSDLKSLGAANSAIAHELAARLQRGGGAESSALEGLRKSDKAWADRQVCVWMDSKLVLNSVPPGVTAQAPTWPSFVKPPFRDVVRDHDHLFLRAADTVTVGGAKLRVLSSEPLDQHLLENLAINLGEITLYAKGLSLHKVDQNQQSTKAAPESENSVRVRKPEGEYVLDTGKEPLVPTFSAGTIPPAQRTGDRLVTFATSLFVVNWESGDVNSPAAVSVQTRLSVLYDRLFAALGEFAPAIEFALVAMVIVFA